MKNLVLVFVIAFAFCTTAMAGDIAISTQGGWMGQGHADTEAQEIVDNVTAVSVEQFTADQQDALADWVVAHTGDGIPDLLIMFGIFPATIYPAGNAEPDGSLAELFLDDGNTIVNTGDYIFYVTSAGANNNADGLVNMMDISVDMWGDPGTDMIPTTEGQAVAPSFQGTNINRPWFPSQLEGTDWQAELIIAQSADGTMADPAIMVNTVTGGRVGTFFQRSDDSLPRGEVISEWINNYVLTDGAIPNSPAWKPSPADGAIDADVGSLEWAAGYGAVSHKVYLSTDETIDDADLIGETDIEIQVADLEPGVTYYWRIDEVDADGNVIEGDIWSFSTLPLEAHFPSPADGGTNYLGTQLSWTAGKDTIMHNVNFGTDPAALLPVSMMQLDASYDAGVLDAGTTYYWRVDEFTPVGTVNGPVWSFSTIGDIPMGDDPNLIAQYQFEEDESTLSALDTSGNGNHGALIGDASIAGGTLSLDGSGDYLDVVVDIPENGCTTAFWFQTTNPDCGLSAVADGPLGAGGYDRMIYLTGGNVGVRIWDTEVIVSSGLNVADGSWHHLVHTYGDAVGGQRLYVDGTLRASGTKAQSNFDWQKRVHFGWSADAAQAYLEGMLDDARIYNKTLTHEEVRIMAGAEALPWSPAPADGASGQSINTVLSWNVGDGAILQDVYFGLDAAAVAAADATDTTGIYRGRQAETTYAPDDIASNTTHYWRVDQFAADGIVAGPVWSFGVAIVIPASADLGAPTSDVPGFFITSLKPQDSAGWGYNGVNEIFDTGLLNGLPPDPDTVGSRIDEFVNLRDTGNGVFSEANGYPDASFPGIDALEVPAQDPADGDDEDNFGTEILGCIQLTAGMHQIGTASDDGTIVWIGGIEIGRTGEWKGASIADLPPFEVEVDGYYDLKARTMEGGGGASVELHEILADGTRILLNDVANGGSAVVAPGPEVLKVDFSRTDGPVEAGFRAYVADHEQADTFTAQTYWAFGATVAITPSWAEDATRQAMQMIARGANEYLGAKVDLLGDWIGTDTRQPGNPMVLTISGLPEGTYEWTSYHHDNDDQSGIFDVTVNDAAGSVTTTDVDISHSNSRNGDPNVAVDFASVTTFSTTMVSDGVNDISLSFSMTSGTEGGDPVHLKFLVMNGLELSIAP